MKNRIMVCMLTVKKQFRVTECEEFSNLVRHQVHSGDEIDNNVSNSWVSSFFHGKFRKYSAVLAKRHYIIKVKEEEAPELPDVEFVCNAIADQLALPIPRYNLINFHHTRAFVSENFISGELSTRNLVHIYHYCPDQSKFNCENLIKVISEKTQHYADIELFIQVCLFDALIGNHDRHGRNLALLTTSSGTRLSPIYDNTSVLGLEHGEILNAHFSPRGKITTKNSDEPMMVDYLKEFKRLRFEDTYNMFFRKIHMPSIIQCIEESTCSQLMKKALIKFITTRYEDFKNAL